MHATTEPQFPANPYLLPPTFPLAWIGGAEAARGVDVTIMPWVDMAAGNLVTLAWGEHALQQVVAADQVGLLTIHVDVSIIQAAGNADALMIRYELHDGPGNRSGWSPVAAVTVALSA
ncbi:hypothetical protein Bsp3421_000186 (plasmid) [Burkholderia sp. FERM BP-3421]|uniref:hypothetical protein n=1 Tax=Burkholderia sp. FERM BP-3421 TaxID=1494466 RepID=UPI00235EE894|nr:hypothetical protein [Burkholderia sp. FERM BP-3421]WDD90353.1 hypothetical protein Bsp3421_000186 [Burkholderia sp. FERM BP-3421]